LKQFYLLGLLLLVIFLVSACGPKEKGPEEVLKREDYPNLETRLFELSISKSPKEYAKKHGLDYKEGKVRVEIELISSESLPAGYTFEVELQYENIIQVFVPVEQLRSLAKEPQVKAIRVPLKPIKD